MTFRSSCPVLLVFIFVLISCKTSKIYIEETKTELIIEQAFIQKEIPGMPNIKPSYYLNILIDQENLKSIQLDSMKLTGNRYTLLSPKNEFQYHTNSIRIALSQNIQNQGNELGEVVLYFHKSNKAYFQKVNEILVKEPIYLP